MVRVVMKSGAKYLLDDRVDYVMLRGALNAEVQEFVELRVNEKVHKYASVTVNRHHIERIEPGKGEAL